MPVDSIAVDLLGLTVDEDDALDVSGMLVPEEHQIWLNGREARQSLGGAASHSRTSLATGSVSTRRDASNRGIAEPRR